MPITFSFLNIVLIATPIINEIFSLFSILHFFIWKSVFNSFYLFFNLFFNGLPARTIWVGSASFGSH